MFVGTNYSFFNQFILLPFASLFDYVAQDKIFLEIDVRKIVDKIPHKKNVPAIRNKIRSNIVNKLLGEGKIPFEQIAMISAKLMEESKVRDVVCNRIQFLFKDEFQDTDTVQLKIFDAIRKGKKTKMYSVGDPEQYILGFTYDLRRVQKPPFDKIPINRFSKDCEECQMNINKRACEQLVEFTNQFHTSIKQVSEVGPIENAGVFFIEHTALDLMISKFIEMTQEVVESCECSRRLFLGYENKTYEGFVEKYGLIPISNENKREKSILTESLDLISSATQLSQKAIGEEYQLDRVGYRKLGIRLMKAMMSESVCTKDELFEFVKNDLGLACENGAVAVESKINKLSFLLKEESSGHNFFSSIHRAKGLEAECVLIVSRSTNELKKWIEIDFVKRCGDKQDTCRIGFVGFTRAKQILCIACKHSIDNPVRTKLIELGVEFVS